MNDTFLSEKLSDLIALWVEKRAQRTYPRKADFDAITVWPWIGHIGILERRTDQKSLFVRLSGSMIVEYDGADFTGRYLADCVPEHAVDDILYPYRVSIDHRAPVFIRLPPGHLGGSFRYYDRLILPCSDNDAFIDHFIVAIYVSKFEKYLNEYGVYGNRALPPLPAYRRDTPRLDATATVCMPDAIPAYADPTVESAATKGQLVEVIHV